MDKERGYLISGDEIVIVKKLKLGFLVQRIREDRETEQEYIDDYIYFEKEVFPNPICIKKASELKELNDEIGKLNKEKRELVSAIELVKTRNQDRLKKYKQYQGLERLGMFLDDKITHFAVLDYQPSIQLKKDALCGGRERYEKEFKLLTLFGRTDGDLLWRINQYSDGSGYGTEVIPCCSYKEAVKILKEYIYKEIKERKNAPHSLDSYIKSAKLYGIEIPKKIINTYKRYLTKRDNDRIKSLKVEIKKIEGRKN